MTSYENFLKTLPAVTEITGQRVKEVENETHGFFKDIFNSALGFVSPWLGKWVESDAVGNLSAFIYKDLHEGKSVRLLAFSQGAILISNALASLKDEIIETEGQDAWNKYSKQLSVYSFGGGTQEWLKDIEVHSYLHVNDKPMRLTNFLSSLCKPLYWLRGTRKVEPIYLDNVGDTFSHSIESYKSLLPQLFLKEYENNPAGLSNFLIRSIKSGLFPDTIHDQIIQTKIDEQDFKFVEEFIEKNDYPFIDSYLNPKYLQMKRILGLQEPLAA